jgi:lipoprotein NlpI
MAELAARRIGRSEGVLLARAANGTDSTDWPQRCVAFLQDRLTEKQFLERALSGPPLATAKKQCEAYFYVAQVALAAGRLDDARSAFDRCLATGITGFVEFFLARRERARLGPIAPPLRAPLPAEPSSDDGDATPDVRVSVRTFPHASVPAT